VSVSLSPDKQWLAATYSDGSGPDRMMIWNFATKILEKDVPINRGRGFERSLTFSHDSKLAAFGGEGLALRRLPMLDQYFQYPGDAIKAVAFSPDDRLLALVQIRGPVILQAVETNQKIATLPHPRGDAPLGGESVAFSADWRFLVSAMMGSVHVWNLRGGGERIVLPGHDESVPTCSFSPDGLYLASGGKDQTARIWNLTAGKLARPELPLPGKVQCLAFSATGPWLATANWTTGDSATPNLHVWNTRHFTKPTVVPHRLGADVHAVTFSPDGHHLAACGDGMSLWRVEEPDFPDAEIKLTHVKHLPGKFSFFAQFSPKSNLLAWADEREKVRIWDIVGKSDITLDRKMDRGWHGLAFVGNEDLAFVTKSRTLEVWNARSNERQFTLGAPGEFPSPHIATTVNGALLAAVDSAGSVALWDVRANKKLFALRPEDSAVWSLAFDRTGNRLAVGLTDGGVAVWDLNNIERRLAELNLSWLGNNDDP
jgi:WD40 repeat protein